MKKITLETESLRVESFHTLAEAEAGRGTVRARESLNPSNEGDDTCPNHTCATPPTIDTTPQCCV